MINTFNTTIATQFGVEEAIFLQHLAQWIFLNQANDRHYYDGRYWSYNTLDAFIVIFPYWTLGQIRRIINSVIKKQLVIKGNYNKQGYDHTTWYAFSDQGLNLFPELLTENPSKPRPGLICRNQQIDLLKSTELYQPITQPKKQIPPIVPQGDVLHFSDFWEKYPVKKGRKACEKKWRAKRLDAKAEVIMAKLNEQIAKDSSWKAGYIPNPLTYINQERWEDEISKPRQQATKPYFRHDEQAKILEREQQAAKRKQEEIAASSQFQEIAQAAITREAAINTPVTTDSRKQPVKLPWGDLVKRLKSSLGEAQIPNLCVDIP